MPHINLFDGDGWRAIFARAAYKALLGRKWVTYAEVMAEVMGLPSGSELPYNVSNCDHYSELKKAFPQVVKAIRERLGALAVTESGNNKDKRFLYTGQDNDPLADMINAKAISDLRKYWQFCQDSAGFFPVSWLEYFFKDCRDLLSIKDRRRRGEQLLQASIDREVRNIELLPMLYVAIKNRLALAFDYKPFDDDDVMHLVFHPHFLKEYNGRWYVFGHAEGREPTDGYNVPLDRIESRPRELYETPYQEAPPAFYQELFRGMVGVSHSLDGKPVDLLIRAHSRYFFKLIDTKKIHASQIIATPFANHDDGTYGDFLLHVEINNELIGRIMQMGDGLEVVFPPEVRGLFKERIKRMFRRYKSE